MNIRAITFDLDDTLWPVGPVIERAERALHAWLSDHCPPVANSYDIRRMRELRSRIAEDHPNIAHDFSALRRRSLEHALHQHGYDGEHVTGAFEVFYAARQEVTLYDDALPALEAAKSRYHLGSISNGNADLALIGLDHYFPVRVHARQLGRAKPDPAIYRHACEQLGLPPNEVLHVGDDPVLDVAGARAAGMRVLWLNRDDRNWDLAAEPPPTIRSLAELERTLPSLD